VLFNTLLAGSENIEDGLVQEDSPFAGENSSGNQLVNQLHVSIATGGNQGATEEEVYSQTSSGGNNKSIRGTGHLPCCRLKHQQKEQQQQQRWCRERCCCRRQQQQQYNIRLAGPIGSSNAQCCCSCTVAAAAAAEGVDAAIFQAAMALSAA
jgi:hypothetical protein